MALISFFEEEVKKLSFDKLKKAVIFFDTCGTNNPGHYQDVLQIEYRKRLRAKGVNV